MNELIKVVERGNVQMVNARDLHEALGVKTDFRHWIGGRIKEFDFVEEKDFYTQSGEVVGGRPEKDYFLTLAMAKELTMLHNGEMGKKIRRYLLQVDDAWNTPEAVIQRARDAGAVVLTEQEAACYEHLMAGIAQTGTPFPGSLVRAVPVCVTRWLTQKGGRVFILEFMPAKLSKTQREVILYGPDGRYLGRDIMLMLMMRATKIAGGPFFDHTVLRDLVVKFKDTVGELGVDSERVSADDFVRWKSSLIKKGVSRFVLPEVKTIPLEEYEKRQEVKRLADASDAKKKETKKKETKKKETKSAPFTHKPAAYIDDDDDVSICF